MMEMVNGSRFGVALMGLGIHRRSFLESAIYAAHREQWGQRIDRYPMVRETLVDLLVTLEAGMALTFECAAASRTAPDPEEGRLLRRILVPLAKVRATRDGLGAAIQGVEILGGSDNVVRGGLTAKHVAVGELRRVLSCEAVTPVVIEPVAGADGEETWVTPRPEFALSRLRFDDSTRSLSIDQPQILLCIEGKIQVGAADGLVVLGGGESAFVTADTGQVTASGRGVLLRATPGRTLALEHFTTRSEA